MMPRPSTGTGWRPEIQRSWDRTRRVHVHPDVHLGARHPLEPDPGSALLIAAGPVLAGLAESLTGSDTHLVLADRQCRLVYRWHEAAPGGDLLDEVGIVLGTSFLESAIGTNALGTAYELREPIAVNTGEHYARSLRAFSCYSRPIFHPLTRRIEGILNIAGLGDGTNPLAIPLVDRAVADIERRLLLGARSSERQLYGAFEVASKRTRRPLVGIGLDTIIANRAAWDTLEPHDVVALRSLLGLPRGRQEATRLLTLSRGRVMRVQVQRVAGLPDAALFQLQPLTPVDAESTGDRAEGWPRTRATLVSGPPGSGRSTTARRCLSGGSMAQLSATTAVVRGESEWIRGFVQASRHGDGGLIVEDLDLLSDRLVAVLQETLAQDHYAPLVFTCGPREQLTGRCAAVAALCDHIEVLPLSLRGDDIQALAQSMLDDLRPGGSVRLTPSVIEALRMNPWPGNLHELKAVMAAVAAHRSSGDVIVSDLPEQYRSPRSRRVLGGREQAERDAIARALADHEGNKSKAAAALGVSRTTLYTRMRALRVVS